MSESNGALVFSEAEIEPHKEKVTLGKKEYELRQASGDAGIKFRNSQSRGGKLQDDGVGGQLVVVGDIANAEPLLVSLCLFEVYDHNGERKTRPVTLIEVLGWNDSVVRRLFDRIKEVSPCLVTPPTKKAKDSENDALKNSQSATVTGSA